MDDKKFEKLMNAYLAEELEEAEREAFERALEAHPQRRAMLESHRRIETMLRALPPSPDPPPSMKTKVMARVRETSGLKERRNWFRLSRPRQWLPALAAASLLGVIAYGILSRIEPPRLIPEKTAPAPHAAKVQRHAGDYRTLAMSDAPILADGKTESRFETGPASGPSGAPPVQLFVYLNNDNVAQIQTETKALKDDDGRRTSLGLEDGLELGQETPDTTKTEKRLGVLWSGGDLARQSARGFPITPEVIEQQLLQNGVKIERLPLPEQAKKIALETAAGATVPSAEIPEHIQDGQPVLSLLCTVAERDQDWVIRNLGQVGIMHLSQTAPPLPPTRPSNGQQPEIARNLLLSQNSLAIDNFIRTPDLNGVVFAVEYPPNGRGTFRRKVSPAQPPSPREAVLDSGEKTTDESGALGLLIKQLDGETSPPADLYAPTPKPTFFQFRIDFYEVAP